MGSESAPGLSRRGMLSLAGVSVASLALLLLLFSRLVAAGHAVNQAPSSPLIGHPAPDFTIVTWNGDAGQRVHLADLKGKAVVVNFWASWCADCSDEARVLQAAWQKYHADRVMFVGIAYNDQQAAGTTFLQQHGIQYPSGAEQNGTASVDYAVTGVPETVFINARGVVVSKSLGAVSDGALDQAVQGLLRQ